MADSGLKRTRARGRALSSSSTSSSSSPASSLTLTPKPQPLSCVTQQVSNLSVHGPAETIGRPMSRAPKPRNSTAPFSTTVPQGGERGEKPVGRGSVRQGRSKDSPILDTKPHNFVSKKGNSGQQVTLNANYFIMKTETKWTLCKHHVDFNPPEDRTFVRKSLMKQHKDKFSGYLFDGSTLFTIKNACPDGVPLELLSQGKDGKDVRMQVKFVGTCEPGDYQYLQVFNIVMRECFSHLKLELIRRNYYDPMAKIEIPDHKLEILPGYSTSVTQCEHNILLQSEISCKVLRKDTAYDLLLDISKKPGDIRVNYSNAIMGCVVLTTYNNKTYRIDEVDFSSFPTSSFPVRKKGEASNLTYEEYYSSKYNVKINDRKQPMLVSRSSAKDRRAGMMELVYLVPELCVMTGLTDEMRSNFRLMKAVADHTNVTPGERVKRLMNFSRRLNGIPEVKKTLKSWGLELMSKLVDIPGRILPAETITVGDGKTYDSGPDADWTRNIRQYKMLLNLSLTNWIILYPARSEREVKGLVEALQTCAKGMYFEVTMPARFPLDDDRAASYIQALDAAINTRHPQLAMCILPNNRADRYSAVKKKCIIDKPTPSQVVLCNTTKNKGLMSIATKIAIQLNCKIGGAAWGVQIPTQGLMAVGFDVCHDPKDKRRSYGAMVATLDRPCTRYFSSISHHSAGEELSNNMGINLRKAVERYGQINKCLPSVITIFRDGVGEGNLAYVKEQELKSIKGSLENVYSSRGIQLKIIFIVVTKRINTRIFYSERNPPPGSVVDDVITSPFKYDFFLVSQNARFGTVSPTHYNVLENTSSWTPEIIQRLTYKFCHLYFNWSGTVRVPAPCQYAHKLAFLTAQSVGVAHSNLDQLLYYL